MSRRGDLVLDPFAGSGSTLTAAHKSGRTARAIELDPLYCDTIVRRFEAYVGQLARREGGLETFEAVAQSRADAGAGER